MNQSKSGFTIVELLIVIVVIGILAAITIVAYSGVQARAQATRMNSSVEHYIKALSLYELDEGTYPIALGAGIGCFDGTSTCWSGANQTLSTTLVDSVRRTIPNAPLSLPYVSLLTSTVAAGYYILYQIPGTQTCPATLSSATLLSTDIHTNGRRNCRLSLVPPST